MKTRKTYIEIPRQRIPPEWNELRERMAKYIHNMWRGHIPYSDLTEGEKESLRAKADKALAIAKGKADATSS